MARMLASGIEAIATDVEAPQTDSEWVENFAKRNAKASIGVKARVCGADAAHLTKPRSPKLNLLEGQQANGCTLDTSGSPTFPPSLR